MRQSSVFVPMHQEVSALIVGILLCGQASLIIAGDGSCIDPDSSSCIDADPFISSPLHRARQLQQPLATDTKNAEFENSSFWDENGILIQDAWKQWEEENIDTDVDTSLEFINPTLSSALNDAFDNPTEETESIVKSHWESSSDDNGQDLPKGVYSTQLITSSGISHIRNLLDMATGLSGIPTRRPNGMNRHGCIIDKEVYGAVSTKSLVQLVEEEIINRVVRPVGRLLFPDRVGCNDDIEYFAFTIRYDGSDDDGVVVGDSTPKKDFELKEHRDASIVTLNINLNLPEEGYDGSGVFFREYPSEEDQNDSINNKSDGGGIVHFTPGMGLIHLGK